MRPSRALAALFAAATLCACPAPRYVSGVVYDGARAEATSTGRAFLRPLAGASVTWSCPAGVVGAPPSQVMTTDRDGRFRSKEFHLDMPAACELEASVPGYVTFHETFGRLCEAPSTSECRSTRVAIELRPLTAPIPLTLPMATTGAAIQTVMKVVVTAAGAILINGVPTADDGAFLEQAKEAQAKNPELRAVIQADASVPYAKVIRVMDLLKQAGVSKIAFGVEPVPPTPEKAIPPR